MRRSALIIAVALLLVSGCGKKGPKDVRLYQKTVDIPPQIALNVNITPPAGKAIHMHIVGNDPETLWEIVLGTGSAGQFEQLANGRVVFRLTSGWVIARGYWPWVVTSRTQAGIDMMTNDPTTYLVNIGATEDDVIHFDGRTNLVMDENGNGAAKLPNIVGSAYSKMSDSGSLTVTSSPTTDQVTLLETVDYYPSVFGAP